MNPSDTAYAATLERLAGLSRFGVRLGLDRVERALERLGRPQTRFAAVHLAGTNGKGSTAAMLASSLARAGLRTGLYTSPHLCRFTERIRVGEVEIPRATAVELVERVLSVEPELTFFEVATVAAFAHFAAEAVEVAVVETGLGGRLDATNVLSPRVCVLTRIALDHTEILGESLAEIAREKAGIIKPGVPAISAPADGPVLEELARRSTALAAPLRLAGRDFEMRATGTSAEYRGRAWRLRGLELGLDGAHQLENAALCLAALEELQDQGVAVAPRHAREGLARVRWPGRLERVGERFLLDGAHNPCGAGALAAALDGRGDRGCALVLGVLGGRDPREIVRPLAPLCSRIVCTRPRSPRAIAPEELARAAAGLVDDVQTAPDLERALGLLERGPAPVLITGSLYLVGEARALLLGEPRDPREVADPLPPST